MERRLGVSQSKRAQKLVVKLGFGIGLWEMRTSQEQMGKRDGGKEKKYGEMSLEPSTAIKHYFVFCFPQGSLSSYSVSVSRQLLKLLDSSYLSYSELKPETPGQSCTT